MIDNPWKDAVIDALIVNWGYQKAHEDDPRRAIRDLIWMEQRYALDPAISKEARDLMSKGYDKACTRMLITGLAFIAVGYVVVVALS